jgi:16S rRNA (cytosine1402-N4)-methyltransferase
MMKDQHTYHVPVMAKEIAGLLLWKKDGIYVDATLGGGGHTSFFLTVLDKNATVIGMDVDHDAIRFASKRLENDPRVKIVNLGYDQIDFVLADLEIEQIDGILYDLGISSFQVDEEQKGFSFMKDAPLDMRFDQTQKLTAEKIVNEYPEEDLIRIFKEYGEERQARKVARKIVEMRKLAPIITTRQLAAIVEGVVKGKYAVKSMARIFQAIRIEVNQELTRLEESLEKVIDFLSPEGRIAVISYHSLEDRLVKNFFKKNSTDCICPPEIPVCTCKHKKRLEILTRKPVVPLQEEIKANPRARSAKLRVAKRIMGL